MFTNTVCNRETKICLQIIADRNHKYYPSWLCSHLCSTSHFKFIS